MAQTSIEWTQETWNPIVGCSIATPGCTNCYAMRMAARIEAMGAAPHYNGTTERVNRKAVWTGKLALAPDQVLVAPLRRHRPTTYFVNSMGDLFHDDCSDSWIDRVFDVMERAPQHVFQVLTKRAGRMKVYISARKSLLPNVWIGVSTERQKEANERIPLLLAAPAAVRFISAEPLLGPLDIREYVRIRRKRAALDWVIVGGESGPRARPMDPAWVEAIRLQCEHSAAAFFFKQWGGKNKKAAGRKLNGRTYDAMPLLSM
jgi:protein gp37